jgi:hypothetical protein
MGILSGAKYNFKFLPIKRLFTDKKSIKLHRHQFLQNFIPLSEIKKVYDEMKVDVSVKLVVAF